jgi:hypothetical protein
MLCPACLCVMIYDIMCTRHRLAYGMIVRVSYRVPGFCERAAEYSTVRVTIHITVRVLHRAGYSIPPGIRTVVVKIKRTFLTFVSSNIHDLNQNGGCRSNTSLCGGRRWRARCLCCFRSEAIRVGLGLKLVNFEQSERFGTAPKLGLGSRRLCGRGTTGTVFA